MLKGYVDNPRENVHIFDNSPETGGFIFALMKFQQYNISADVKKRLDELGFKKPTDIQYKAIPSILKGEDVLAIAQTGTGKTAAFAIPVLHLLQKQDYYEQPRTGRKRWSAPQQVRCLVMVPTRELCIQIGEVFESLGLYTGLDILALHGGVLQEPQIEAIQDGIDVLISTPGRMFDLVHQKILSLQAVQILILDEADLMLDMGFIKDIRDVKRLLPKKHQTLFFSATITPEIKDLAYSLVYNPIRIQISPKDPVSKNVQHAVAFIAMDDKRFFLERLVKENADQKMLVFVRTKVRAERVQKAMERVGLPAVIMHGGLAQEDRMDALHQFKSGSVQLLIATDVSARGIDIPGVDMVVNYDLPDQADQYVHRVGRTGRGVQKGRAVSFCAEEEKPLLQAIELYIGKQVEQLEVDKTSYETTILQSSDTTNYNWNLLIKEHEEALAKSKKKSKKKK